jgi:hypothetical protein
MITPEKTFFPARITGEIGKHDTKIGQPMRTYESSLQKIDRV